MFVWLKGYSSILAIAVLGLVGWASPFLVWWMNSHGFAAGPAIPYANNGHCDVWYYFGLATFAKSAWILAPESRFIARVTAYLPIYGLEKLMPFTAVERSFILYHSLTYVGAALAILPLYGSRIAVISAVLVTTSALYISVLSTTYPSGAALAYGMLALACLTNAAILPNYWKRVSLCALAGLFLSWAAIAHAMVAIYLAFLPFMLVTRRGYGPCLLSDLLAILLGGVAGLILTGLASLSMGQPFHLFWYQVKAALDGIGDWYRTDLLEQSVALPLSVGLSVALLVASIRNGDRRTAIVTAILSATTIYAFTQTFVSNGTSLVYDQFFVLLLVPSTLAIAELIRRPDSEPLPQIVIVAIVGGHLLLMSLLATYVDLRNIYLKHAMVLTCTFMVGLIVATIFRRLALIITMLFLGLQAAIANYSRSHWMVDPVVERDRVHTVEQILSYIDQSHINTRPVVWISSEADIDLALATVRSLVRCRFETTFPNLLVDLGKRPVQGQSLLIVLTPPDVTTDDINEALKRNYFGFEDHRSEVFGSRLRRLRVTIGRI